MAVAASRPVAPLAAPAAVGLLAASPSRPRARGRAPAAGARRPACAEEASRWRPLLAGLGCVLVRGLAGPRAARPMAPAAVAASWRGGGGVALRAGGAEEPLRRPLPGSGPLPPPLRARDGLVEGAPPEDVFTWDTARARRSRCSTAVLLEPGQW
ncbi:unnamed protein product, partial [Prorocentrum cordatum]